MFEVLRKVILAGLGMVTLKEEKVKEIVNDLIEQGQLSKEEGNQFVKDLGERLERNRAELERKVGEILNRTLEKMNLATKEELSRLAKEQQELLTRIERLERGEQVGEKSPGSG
ncbi:MAG: hypothetical protein V1878_04285 [bacterium]